MKANIICGNNNKVTSTLLIILVLFSTNIVAQTSIVVDTDGNGLIEINDLETLNAIRFQLDGASYRATTDATIGITEGCPNDRCIGYELTRNLDFSDDSSYSSTVNKIIWTTGEGWQPIGDTSNAFTSKFEGYGFTISNLKINRSDTDNVGLFGFVGADAEITNVGLLDVDITGNDRIGSLVSFNSSGTITNSYATGSVSGSGSDVGGLVGLNNGGTITNSYATGSVSGSSDVGGLVGLNDNGTITNSYATGSVSGDENVGGLVGLNDNGTITNSYATGSVSGDENVGGLVGLNDSRGTITNSYATGSVSGDKFVGGLVGLNNGGITNSYATGSVAGPDHDVGGLVGENKGDTITRSYWDSDTSGRTTSAGGMSKTTVELQSPTTATGIYRDWSDDDWDFGTSSQYPVLKYTDNPNTDSSECRSADDTSTALPLCGSLLSPILRGLSELQLVQGELSPDFNVAVPNYTGTVVNSISTIQFRPITINPNAKVYITAEGQTRGLAIDNGNESSMISLNTNRITTITVEVENGGETTQTVIYTLYLYYEFSRGLDRDDVDRDDDGLIEIDDLETLNAIRYQLDGSHLRLSGVVPTSVGCARGGCKGYELTQDLDFNNDDSYSSTANRIIWTTGTGWQPIGDSSDAFTGKFEGNGFTISNLKIDRSGIDNVGLFGTVGQKVEIANMGLLDIDIKGLRNVGGLVGWNSGGTITNSYATGSVSGKSFCIGGLVGWNSGGITNSYATGSVSGESLYVGGLVCLNSSRGTITNSYATGSVSGESFFVGGLVGLNSRGTITNSHATGSVSGTFNDVGGLVGSNSGGITNSYATGSVSGTNFYIGGLVGSNSGGITNSYATGSVSGKSFYVGGLVGSNSGGITNSYATGSVSGTINDVGGLVGLNNSRGTITNSYATGSVSGSSNIGGLVGSNSGGITNSYATGSVAGSGNDVGGLVGLNSSRGTSTSSYWDSDTSGITTSAGGTSKTTVELQSTTTATGIYMNWHSDNWDFGTRSQYPVLKYTDNPNTVSSECRSADDTSTDLPICGSLLSPILRYGLNELQLVQGELSPDFDVVVPDYRGTVVNSTSTVQFRPITVNTNTKVYITAGEQTKGLAIDSGDESSMISLNTNGITIITVEVENGGETTQTIIYTLYLYYEYRDVDRDDDGLIEIDDLETLNAIRYQLDGGHLQLSGEAPTSVGCALSGCMGYELTQDLDFDDDDSYSSPANRIIWTTGAGWQPIGDSSSAFTGKFEGNGFTISNLKIDRPDTDYVGLFGFVGQEAEITNVGLLDVDITGNDRVGGLVGENDSSITNSYATGSVSGEDDVGGLVGWNLGGITNSYATGSVAGSGNSVGGLVGFSVTITNSYATGSVSGESSFVGGLVGWNNGTVTNSYATGFVEGSVDDIGGLVGWNLGGITNSYATGSVAGSSDVGGLVGQNDSSIMNSYATGFVSGSGDNIGGLVGENEGTIANSYWDSDTSGRATSDGGMSKTTVELQSPVMPGPTMNDTYYNWSNDDWDFGTNSQYPVLRYSNNCRSAGDISTDLPLCGSLLSPILRGLSELQLVQGELSPDFDVAVPNYRGTVVNSTSTIQFRPITVNPDAKVYVTAGEQTRGLAIDSGDESSMISLNTHGITTITVEVENGGETTQTVIYTLYLYYEYRDVDRDDNGLIEIDDLETLNAIRYQLDGSHLQLSGVVPTSIGCARGGCKGYELTRNLDFDDDDSYSSTANKIIWTTEAGWQPIGDFSNAFTGKFEGNGFTISNLKIDRPDTDYVGLFSFVGQEAEITNVGLLGVDITGDNFVGSLVSFNSSGTITNSYATGSVSGESFFVGGLAGFNDNGTITNSYATGSVSGVDYVGGLVGGNSSGTITNSYATGFVLGSGSSIGGLVGENSGTIMNSYAKGSVAGSGDSIGGLVGGNSSGTITNSYATGFVLGSGNGVGGLVGGSLSGTIINSYWDSDTSGITTSAGGTSKTTVALQSPTTATGIYDSWSNDDWDFGTTKQYPAVKYTPGDDSSNPACDSEPRTPLPSCDSILPGQRGLPPIENTTPTITIIPSMPQILPVGSTAHIVVSVVDDNFNLDDTVTLLVISSSRTIVLVTPVQVANITTDTITTFMLDAKQGGEAIITFTAIDIRGLRDSVELLVRVNATPTISGIPQQPIRILEGLSTELEVAISDADADDSLDVRIETNDSMIATATIIATSGTARILKISGVSAGDAMITVTVDDGTDAANSSASATFEVQVIENTTPTIMITPSTDQTLPLNSTAHLVVSVADDDFNLDDIVTLSAMSSSQTIVSVVPAQVAGITTDTTTTFILSAGQNGETTITFTATDSRGSSDSKTVSVNVITVIRIHVKVFLEGLLQ